MPFFNYFSRSDRLRFPIVTSITRSDLSAVRFPFAGSKPGAFCVIDIPSASLTELLSTTDKVRGIDCNGDIYFSLFFFPAFSDLQRVRSWVEFQLLALVLCNRRENIRQRAPVDKLSELILKLDRIVVGYVT